MKGWLSRLLGGSTCRRAGQRRSYRPQLEALEPREVASATSWFDSYHPAEVSACGQERRADHVAFAINDHHRLIETDGKAAVDVGKGVDYGYADDICAGRDFYGNAQCLVRGAANHIDLFNQHDGWKDLKFENTFRTVWQISAGGNGSLFVLDTGGCVWMYDPSGRLSGKPPEAHLYWIAIRENVAEIQAAQNFFDAGLYVRDNSRQVWHGGTFFFIGRTPHLSWERLLLPSAHALSVDSSDVFIINDDHRVLHWDGGTFADPWSGKGWHYAGGLLFDAIDASRAVTQDATFLVYGHEVNTEHGHDCTPGVDSCHGLGSIGWDAFDARTGIWHWTGFGANDFSGASGTTTVFAQTGGASGYGVYCIDWFGDWHHLPRSHWICATP
jgi:hypothetical protein